MLAVKSLKFLNLAKTDANYMRKQKQQVQDEEVPWFGDGQDMYIRCYDMLKSFWKSSFSLKLPGPFTYVH